MNATRQECSEDLEPDSLTVFGVTWKQEPADLPKFYFLRTAAQAGSSRGMLELIRMCARCRLTPYSATSRW